ncbi:MAG: hypothetical protein ABJA60_12845, partial [Nitrosospira sp.]
NYAHGGRSGAKCARKRLKRGEKHEKQTTIAKNIAQCGVAQTKTAHYATVSAEIDLIRVSLGQPKGKTGG